MAKKVVKKQKTVKKPAISRKPAVQRVKPVAVKAKPAPEKGPVRQKGYSKGELEHFRKIIMEKRKEILEQLETLRATIMDSTTGEYTQENSAYSLHMEQGTDTMEREKTFLFASREGKFLNYLDDALKRIDKGDYGFCNDCGKLIEKERLEAVPHAQLCVDCKLKRGK
ncbi:MAG: TraR/DksA C4-type zinc finger protein [Ignavibacteriales bacterium]|nr:TraR/DksA C4-type zinc finger protein [Ignavibacteriales bacterium]